MIVVGLVLVVTASVLHCWYAGHATEPMRNRALLHQKFGTFILRLSIALLGIGTLNDLVGVQLSRGIYHIMCVFRCIFMDFNEFDHILDGI